MASDDVVCYTPPTHEVPIFSPGNILRFYRSTQANSIVRIGGMFTSMHTLDPEVLKGLTEGVDYFRGGYEYEISQALANQLSAAGFPNGR